MASEHQGRPHEDARDAAGQRRGEEEGPGALRAVSRTLHVRPCRPGRWRPRQGVAWEPGSVSHLQREGGHTGRGEGKVRRGRAAVWAGGSAGLGGCAGLLAAALPQGRQAASPAHTPGLRAALRVQGRNSEARPRGALLPGVGRLGADASCPAVTWGSAPLVSWACGEPASQTKDILGSRGAPLALPAGGGVWEAGQTGPALSSRQGWGYARYPPTQPACLTVWRPAWPGPLATPGPLACPGCPLCSLL